jgi:hypothetical protein
MCGNLQIHEMTPMPHQIEKNLFLGSRAFTITPEALQQLSIFVSFFSFLLFLRRLMK